ncbi:Glycyl-tRNA_synthetase [Hexamita inflata]|uniref:Glycyl-tRNA_synthetase n=1 Tax=Hexamita inflata TaxID=28002 RepID=A0ABP1GG91_9EUKA
MPQTLQIITYIEIGIPYIVTVDFDSLIYKKVTLRERHSMAQIRIVATINQTSF